MQVITITLGSNLAITNKVKDMYTQQLCSQCMKKNNVSQTAGVDPLMEHESSVVDLE